MLNYNWHLNLTDNKAAIDLELQSNKKYKKRAIQIADELSHHQDFFSAFTIFVNKSHINYDQKTQLNKCLRLGQNKDHIYFNI